MPVIGIANLFTPRACGPVNVERDSGRLFEGRLGVACACFCQWCRCAWLGFVAARRCVVGGDVFLDGGADGSGGDAGAVAVGGDRGWGGGC